MPLRVNPLLLLGNVRFIVDSPMDILVVVVSLVRLKFPSNCRQVLWAQLVRLWLLTLLFRRLTASSSFLEVRLLVILMVLRLVLLVTKWEMIDWSTGVPVETLRTPPRCDRANSACWTIQDSFGRPPLARPLVAVGSRSSDAYSC